MLRFSRIALRRAGRVRPPSPASLLAAVALFFALSGTVVAASKIARNSVGSAEIKNGSIKAGDIARDALTGAQIDEQELGVVPRAAAAGTATTAKAAAEAQHAAEATRSTTADRAANADRAATADQATNAGTVDGRDAADFAASEEVFPVAVGLNGGESRTLVERDGLRVVARCSTGVGTTSGGTADVLIIVVEAAADGASFSGPKGELDGSSGSTLGPSTPESKRIAVQQTANSGVRVMRVPPDGISATSAGGTSVFVGSGGTIRVGFNLYGSVCSVSAPVMVTSLR